MLSGVFFEGGRRFPMAGERVLVVDDERVILDLTTMILNSRGYEVLTASGGLEALDKVSSLAPELVLLDYMMPGMDGMTTLQQIRRDFPDTYVIMFTGKGNEEIAVELMKSGASDYLLKPFNHHNLLERIDNVLRLRRIELHNRQLQQEREQLLRVIEEWNCELERRVAQKGVELERAHAEIVQAEKLAALGHLSAGMAHEIRNPLNAIGLFSQLLQAGLAHDAEKSGYLDRIRAEVERIDNILVKLLSVSKRPRVELHPVPVCTAVDAALDQFLPLLQNQGVVVEKHFPAQPAAVLADAGEIEQIFTNLFINALHEMKEGGRLLVRVELDEAARLVKITVADSGPGIPRANLGRIFDPFFTTKTRGTGFGLSVVLRVVHSYGGRISVSSEPGEGAVFQIEFPLQ